MKCFGNRKVNFIIKLVLLDDQEVIQEIQRNSKGQELLDNVFKHLNIIETAYFGLRYLDVNGQPHWLDGTKEVIKQISDTRTLYFGVKFYSVDPCKLFEEITRYQFFLQIKKDIYQGRLTVSNELCAELGALAVQSELGDHDPRRHLQGYVSEFRFVANQSEDLEATIAELHKNLVGQVPAVAELNYLEKVKWLDMYGVDLHPVLGEDKIDYFLGLTPSAIVVLRNKTKVGNYFWPRITKLSIKGKYFMIRVKNRTEEQTYGFESPSKSACKHLYKSASEHHTFFRLVQVTPNPTNPNKTFTLGSRFRDSRSSDSSARRRAQPQFIRIPSRKYTRRYVEGSDTPSIHQSHNHEMQTTKLKDWTHHISRPQQQQQEKEVPSPKSVRSSKSVQVNSRKYSVPSPRSSRSAHVSHGHGHHHRRSHSVESNSSVESLKRHSRRSRRKSSDGESETNSTRSSSKKRRHRRSSGGSDSESCRHKRSHHHHHSEPVRWKEATMTAPASASVSNVIDLNNKENGQALNSNSHSNTHNQSHRSKRRSSHHSRKKEKVLSDEIKKHLDFELIDTTGMSYEELRRIGYKRVDVGNSIAHSVKSGHSGVEPKKTPLQLLAGESPPPPYHESTHPQLQQQQQQQSFGLPSTKSLASTMERSHNISSSYNTAVSLKEHKPLQETPKRPPTTETNHPRYNHSNQVHNSSSINHHHQNNYSNSNQSNITLYNNPQGRPNYEEMSQSPTQTHLKQDIFHDNSDSGLGTDREYYRGGNVSSLSYTLNRRNNEAAPQTQSSHTYSNHDAQASEYWNSMKLNGDGLDIDYAHWNSSQRHAQQQIDNHSGSTLIEQRNNVGSSSLEMILSPLLSSTRTRL